MGRTAGLVGVGFACVVLCLSLGLVASEAQAARAPKTDYTWSMDLDCTLCHQNEAATLSGVAEVAAEAEQNAKEQVKEAEKDKGSEKDAEVAKIAACGGLEGYAVAHVEGFGFTCTTCHEESAGLDKAHKKLNSGKESTRLKKTTISSDVCLTCHKADDLAEATKDSTVLTDDNGTVVNPHELPEVGEHASIVCTDCHQVHSQKELERTAMTTCTECHHASVFECGTCH